MTKSKFADFAGAVSIHMARELALAAGVPAAQVDLWVLQLVHGSK